jgi:hypothetical protein
MMDRDYHQDFQEWVGVLMFHPRNAGPGAPDDVARVMVKVDALGAHFARKNKCEPIQAELVKQWHEKNPVERESIPVLRSQLPADLLAT